MDYKYEANAQESYANQYSKDPETAKYDDYNKYPKEEVKQTIFTRDSVSTNESIYTREFIYTRGSIYTR